MKNNLSWSLNFRKRSISSLSSCLKSHCSSTGHEKRLTASRKRFSAKAVALHGKLIILLMLPDAFDKSWTLIDCVWYFYEGLFYLFSFIVNHWQLLITNTFVLVKRHTKRKIGLLQSLRIVNRSKSSGSLTRSSSLNWLSIPHTNFSENPGHCSSTYGSRDIHHNGYVLYWMRISELKYSGNPHTRAKEIIESNIGLTLENASLKTAWAGCREARIYSQPASASREPDYCLHRPATLKFRLS